MSKEMNLNGEFFTVVEPKKNFPNLATIERCAGKDLFDYYGRPSNTKINIWRAWLKWAENTPGVSLFGVCSGCSHFFSISELYTDENGVKYAMHITSAYNKLVKFGEV